jgi:hypothetical protein
VDSRQYKVDSKTSGQQTADSRQQTADSGQQTAQETAGSRQQAADSRQRQGAKAAGTAGRGKTADSKTLDNTTHIMLKLFGALQSTQRFLANYIHTQKCGLALHCCYSSQCFKSFFCSFATKSTHRFGGALETYLKYLILLILVPRLLLSLPGES